MKRALLLAVVAVLLGLAMVSETAAATNGIECGCSKTGPYVSPDSGVGPAAAATSPHGLYSLAATGNGPVNLTIRRVSDNAQRLSVSIPITSAWGFSPDDHRFVYWYVTGTVTNVVLYDLQAGRQVWSTAVAGAPSRIQFSRHGAYLLYATITAPSHTMLTVVDANASSSSAAVRYESEFTFTTPPGSPGDSFGVANWGWSPDDNDRSFVYAWVSGSNSVMWNLVNLERSTARLVRSSTLTTTSGFWQFSPCGDVIGLVTQLSSSFVTIQLIKTEDGSALGSSPTFSIGATLRADAANHVAVVSGTANTLAANTAGAACAVPVSLSSVSINPTSVQGGHSATGTVTLSGAAPTGGLRVTLSSSGTVASPPGGVTVPGGLTSATFTINTSTVTASTPVTISGVAGAATRTATLTVVPAPPPVTGTAVRPGFNASGLPGNDDGSTGLLPIGFSINFFGNTFSSLYLNNNGNLTFDAPMGTYTPFNIITTGRVIIAPFFADVDTRAGPITQYGTGNVNGRPAWGATWPGVGCFSVNTSVLNNFQVVLIDRSDVTAGDFDIEFNYNQIQWETGQASGGNTLCQGGSAVRVGYSNGTTTAFELPGSGVSGYFLDSSATALIRNSRNTLQQGRYVFPVRNGAAPVGGTILGTIYRASVAPANVVDGAFVQVCLSGGQCTLTQSNSSGQYSASGLADGSYTVSANSPGSFTGLPTSVGPVIVSAASTVTAPDIVLAASSAPPAGTTITSRSTNGDGLPVIYWNDTLTLRTQGCTGGTASYQMVLAGTTTPVRSGSMAEGPAGIYTATIAALYPNHGYARVSITIDCPGSGASTTSFDVYIDPSGTVKTTSGEPLSGATVSLFRSEGPTGPFDLVPDGSGIMSPANRVNPDVTDSSGHFGWDVIAGYYKVRAEMPGCTAPGNTAQAFVESAVLSIPPPVTDLQLTLACPEPGAVTLSPLTATKLIGNDITFVAHVVDQTGANAAGVAVTFEVLSGPNTGRSATLDTDATGQTSFTYSSAATGADTVGARFTNGAGLPVRSAQASVTWAPADSTAPSCVLSGVVNGPPKQILITVQDAGSGLKSIAPTSNTTNATVTWPPFATGSTSPLVVTATKINQSLGSRVELTVSDVAGNVTTCDPVLADLGRNQAAQVFTGIAQSESTISIQNGTPGLSVVRAVVNGRRFTAGGLRDGELRTLDVASAMRSGSNNTVVLQGSGPRNGSASVLIWDGNGVLPSLPTSGVSSRHAIQLEDHGATSDPRITNLLTWIGGEERTDASGDQTSTTNQPGRDVKP
jgi:nidogen-like